MIRFQHRRWPQCIFAIIVIAVTACRFSELVLAADPAAAAPENTNFTALPGGRFG